MRNYGRRYAIYASGWKDGTPDRSSNPSRTIETEKGEKGRRCTMIYSQLVDMIGHHRKDMSFFFFLGEKGEKRSTDNVGTHVGYRGSNESCRTLI